MRNEAWQRALDVQMDYHKWCSTDIGMLYNFAFFNDVLSRVSDSPNFHANRWEIDPNVITPAAQMSKHLIECLWQADTMFVTSDMLHLLAQAAQDLPADAAFDEHTLITPCGFCLFEEPLIGQDQHDNSITFHGLLWRKDVFGTYNKDNPHEVKQRRVLMIYFLTDPHDPRDDYSKDFVNNFRKDGQPVPPLAVQHFYPASFGNTVPDKPDVVGSFMITNALKIFIAMQLLAQQKIGEPIHMRPDRHLRKRVQRHFHGDERLITLITLRRKSVKHDNEEPGKVEWSRRWAVQGHWRHQWYPSLQRHDWVYIHEYVKGPEDKPFIPSERRVFNFRR